METKMNGKVEIELKDFVELVNVQKDYTTKIEQLENEKMVINNQLKESEARCDDLLDYLLMACIFSNDTNKSWFENYTLEEAIERGIGCYLFRYFDTLKRYFSEEDLLEYAYNCYYESKARMGRKVESKEEVSASC